MYIIFSHIQMPHISSETPHLTSEFQPMILNPNGSIDRGNNLYNNELIYK